MLGSHCEFKWIVLLVVHAAMCNLPVEAPFLAGSSFSSASFSTLAPFSLVSVTSPFSDALESSSTSSTTFSTTFAGFSSSTTFFSGVLTTLVSLKMEIWLKIYRIYIGNFKLELQNSN